MGTVAYMSPEQVRGQDLDHRSDIFSFGIILYEMLSGQRAFTGEMMADVMSAITRDDPPELSETNAKVSPALDKIVRRCLEKKPEMRFQTASDLGFALSTLTTSSGSRLETATAVAAVTESAPVSTARWFSNVRLWMAVAAVAVLVSLISLPFAVKYLRQTPPVEAVPTRFVIGAPENVTVLLTPMISPDGRNLAIAGVWEGKTRLWVRPLGSLTTQRLTGVESVNGLHFWSPDSRSLAFVSDGKLKRIELAGGAAQTLCPMPTGADTRGPTAWNREGVILFTASGGNIYRVAATGGEPVLVLGSEQPNRDAHYRWPAFLPDGRHFLFAKSTLQAGAAEIHLASLDSKETTRLMTADSQAIYATDGRENGYLLFAVDGALKAQPFDAQSLRLTGESFVVADKVAVVQGTRAKISVSDNGTLVYDATAIGSDRQLNWVDVTGKRLEPVGTLGVINAPRLSPDGKKVAVVRLDPQSPGSDIYVIDLARGTSSRLTFDPGDDRDPVWSPDGSHIAWSANRDGAFQIYQKLASGVGPEELLLKADERLGPGDWSADGRFLLYSREAQKTKYDLWVLPLAGDHQPSLFLQTPFQEDWGRFSPDGRWIAYISNDQGRAEVYVQTFPASGGKWQISTSGGYIPRWRSDGKELYYISGDLKLMAVEVKSGSSFEAGVPRVLFDLALPRVISTNFGGYDVSADGQRFLFVTRRDRRPRVCNTPS